MDQWQLPSLKHWMDDLVDGLTSGICQVVLLPKRSGPERLLEELRSRLWAHKDIPEFVNLDPNLGRHTADTTQLSVDVIAERIADRLQLSREPGRRFGPSDLAEHDELERSVLFVDLTDAKFSEESWFEFVSAYASASIGVHVADRSTLVIVARPEVESSVPLSDVAIRSSWWWGVVGHLDCAVLIHFSSQAKHVLAAEIVEMARWDLSLAMNLSNRNGNWRDIERVEDLFETLEIGMNLPNEDEVEANPKKLRFNPESPGIWIAEWHLGLINMWRGRPDKHVLLTDDVPTRRWTAQLSVAFPYLEELRLDIGQRLSDAALSLGESNTLDGTLVSDLELGPMRHWQEHNLPEADPALKILLARARNARNRLAHRVPLTVSEMRALADSAAEAKISSRRIL